MKKILYFMMLALLLVSCDAMYVEQVLLSNESSQTIITGKMGAHAIFDEFVKDTAMIAPHSSRIIYHDEWITGWFTKAPKRTTSMPDRWDAFCKDSIKICTADGRFIDVDWSDRSRFTYSGVGQGATWTLTITDADLVAAE